MRTLPAAITNALAANYAEPSIVVTAQDYPRRLSSYAATGQASARSHAIITSANTILRAWIPTAGGAITIQRITDPTSTSQWAAAGTVIDSGTMRGAAGVCLVQTGSTIRCFFVDNVSLALHYRDSTNDGVTWGAQNNVQTGPPSGYTDCTGIAAMKTTDVLSAWHVYPQAASNLFRNVSNGAYTSVGPTSPTWGQLRGIAVDTQDGTNYVVCAGIQLRAQLSGIAAAVTTWNGTTWTAWLALHDMDTPSNGLTHANPTIHWNAADGVYYAGINLYDDGTISGSSQNRVYIWSSSNRVDWHLVQAVPSLSNETHYFKYGVNSYVFDNTTIYQNPPAAAGVDITADVLAIHIHEQVDHTTAFTITLANTSGQYIATSYIRDNAALSIALGYNGTTVPCHTCYIDAIEYRSTPHEKVAIIHGRDLTKFLDQVTNKLVTYTAQTIGTIATNLCLKATITLNTLPATAQFSQALPSFSVLPGQTWLAALKRLSNVYTFAWQATATPSVKLSERNSADASVWSYGSEHLGIAWQVSADQTNVIRVIGAPTSTTNVFAQVQDTANITGSGVHRYEQIVDRLLDTSARCAIRAALALRDAQAKSATGSLNVSLNPGLEVQDVITITEANVGLSSQRARITAIQTQIDFHNGAWHQTLSLEKP